MKETKMNDSQSLHLTFNAKTLDAICNAVAARPWIEANPILTDIASQVAAQKQKAPEGALPAIDPE